MELQTVPLFYMVVFCMVSVCVHGKSINENINEIGSGWHIHVTMHVFSGREDPTWKVHSSHPAYANILHNMKTLPAQQIPSKLGYRGFSLVHVPAGMSVSDGGFFNHTLTSYPEWEILLLGTFDGMDTELREHARHTIAKTQVARHKRSYDMQSLYGNDLSSLFYTPVDHIDQLTDTDMYRLVKLLGLDKTYLNKTVARPHNGPTNYEPSKWNKYFIEQHNNCYNYVNNRITDTFAQPGRAGQCTMPDIATGHDIEQAAVCDGLRIVKAPDASTLPKHTGNLVALVFWPPKPGSSLYDFHWYRQDETGYWSHKPGHTGATDIDSSDRRITDPRHADRGPYTEFVSFLVTQQDKVLII